MATVKKSKKKIIIPICIVLVIAIIAGSVFAYAKNNQGESVSLHTIATDDIHETVSLTGDVTSGTVKEYKVGTVATVKEVFVKVGDNVKKDDVLATFDTDSLNAQISSLQASYDDSIKSYNESVKSQKAAKEKADALAAQIKELEKQVAKLEENASTTTTTTQKLSTTMTTTKATTAKTTTKNGSTTDTFLTTKQTTAPTTKATTEKKTTNNSTNAITPSVNPTLPSTSAKDGKYNVVVAVAPSNNYGKVTGDGSYNENESVTIVATANPGYDFVGWFSSVSEVVNGKPVSTDASYTFNVTGDKSFVAYFTVSSNPNNTTEPTVPSSNNTNNSVPNVTLPSATNTPTNNSESTTISISSSIEDIASSLKSLNETFALITQDLDTIMTLTDVVATSISNAVATGQLNSQAIADLVAADVSQAIKDGVIDSTTFIVENEVAVKLIEAAVAQIDFQGIADAVVNSNNVTLTASEVQLAALYAQYEIYSIQADGSISSAQKKAADATKTALDVLKKQQSEMAGGWKAAFDGVITAVDIAPGENATALSTGITLENLNQLVVTVSLGEHDLHKVNVGMPAVVKTAYGKYDGEVATIAPTATGGSSTSILDSVGSMAGISGLSSLTSSGAGVECTITIDDPDENIIVGFDADVEIQTGEYIGVTVVPIELISLEKTGTYVYLYNEEESTAVKTLIETGAVSDSSYQVTSGLKVGDKIVSKPSTVTEDETFKVKVTNDK